ncbi:MAG: WD40/YVTN/BNR-like repeat-containing protein [Gemmatimonadales bacterium]
MTRRLWTTAAILSAVGAPLAAQTRATLDSTLLAGFRWRPIGPANMAGRITDVEGIPGSATFFFAAASGGVWKTTNGGTTFRPVFDHERCVSMGDLAIAPSDTLQVWAGTGEEDSRNSISPGCGIFKSTDGGLTWNPMGLERTGAIGRVVVHPTNPNIVYVAAVGQIWGANPERGLYKTADGGRTWQLVKFISNKAGFVDIAMDPSNPEVLFAASWERVRGPYFLQSGGPGSALWKTTDGGRTWSEVKGGGFPATTKGRIGLAFAPSNNRVIYALVEAAPPSGKGDGCRASAPGGCGLYRSQDGGATWEWMNGNNVRPFYYSQVRVDPKDPSRVYWSSTPVNYSNDGGKTIGNATVGIHVDHHAMWIDRTTRITSSWGTTAASPSRGTRAAPTTSPTCCRWASSTTSATGWNSPTAFAAGSRTTARGARTAGGARATSPTPTGPTWAAGTASSRSRTRPTRTSSTSSRRAGTCRG